MFWTPPTAALPLTCGLIVSTPAGWLLGHTALTPYWDLPKGKMEWGENPLDAAFRECEEETGLDLRAWRGQCRDLGLAPYNRKRGKTLQLFRLELAEPLALHECASRTRVVREGKDVLDMDDFAWVPALEVPQHVKPRMAKHLRRRGLLEATA